MESEDKWNQLCKNSQQIQQFLVDNNDRFTSAYSDCQGILEYAIQTGRADIAALILSNGGRITKPIFLGSWEAMSIPVFQSMLDAGWDINRQEDWRDTLTEAMRISTKEKSLEIVKWLIAHGADPSMQQPLRSRLSEAAIFSSTDVMLVLIQSGLEINGSRALENAARKGRVDMVIFLLDNGADVNEVNDNSWTRLHEYEKGVGTALHAAAAHGQIAVVKVLLERSADLDMKDNNGKTALERAAGEGQEDVVAFLKGYSGRS